MSSPAAAATTTPAPITAPASAAAASSKRPAEESGECPVAKKPKPAVRVEVLVQIKEEMTAAARWFSKFCWTRFMVETQKELLKNSSDGQIIEDLYKEYRDDAEREHKEWKEWTAVNNARDAAVKRFEEPEPPKVLSLWAWSFMTGPLSCENEFSDHFDPDTLETIVDAPTEDGEVKCTGSLSETVEAILENEHETAEMDHASHPVGMLVSGVVMRSNAPWLSADDLEKIARAHGSRSETRDEMIRDIYRSQIALCQEIVDAGIDMGEEARGYCAARGVIDDNKKALNLRVLRNERPNRRDRVERIPHSAKGLEGTSCMQCGYTFDEADAAVKESYPQHLLDAVCTACSALPTC